MGAKFSCLRLWRRDADKSDPNDSTTRSAYDTLNAFDMLTEGCVELPPNPYQGRTQTIPPPSCLLTAHSFYALQKKLPPLTQFQKLELVFSTWEHGFSRSAMHRQVGDMCENTNGRVCSDLLLLVKPAVHRRRKPTSSTSPSTVSTTTSSGKSDEDSTSSSIVLGCYIPAGMPIGGAKRYHGTEGTFLFDGLAVQPETLTLERVCAVASPKVNDYFVSSPATGDLLLAIGGGGRGPAIRIDSSLEEVSCSTDCATFDKQTYWRLLPTEDDEWEVEGVTLEGGEPKAALSALELWRFSNDQVIFPAMS